MKAADAIASVERWGRISGVGKRLMEKTKELAQVDDYTLEFRLSEPYGTILIGLAHNTQACTITPSRSLTQPAREPMTNSDQYIGTGPYRLVKWQRDAAMRFERFDDYKSPPRMARRATAAPSTLMPMRSSSFPCRTRRRLAGLQAGDYHLGLDIGNDQYTVLQDFPGVVSEILIPTNWDVFFFELEVTNDGKPGYAPGGSGSIRPHADAAIGSGRRRVYSARPRADDAADPLALDGRRGALHVNDPDLAKQKLQEAEYDGEPLRFMTTQEYSYMYGEAIVAQQQLGGQHHRRSPGDGLGDAAGAAGKAGRMGHVRDRSRVRP